MSFAKEGALSTRSIPVLFAVFDWNGALMKSDAKRFEVRLTEEARAAASRDGLPLRAEFDVVAGNYLVRVVVADANRNVLASVTPRGYGAMTHQRPVALGPSPHVWTRLRR